ncbi:hypothetical protein GE09DRAFT_378255 [Coniochaeta sp. 2T2.1]|nr:hypothetical protein GE09DRAFT_378255 [Coniochaeta sp. 2T2.1]
MTVTELAVLHCLAGTVTPDLKHLLATASKVQSAWLATNQSTSTSAPQERGESFFQQVEDPSKFLITATWSSLASHHEWIAPSDNASVLGPILSHIDVAQTSLRHVEGRLFAGPAPEGLKRMLEAPVVSVGRTYLKKEMKIKADSKIREISEEMTAFASPYEWRWGWVVDGKEEEDKGLLQFVIVAGWESIERHRSFKTHPTQKRWQEFVDLAESTGFVHYERFL